MEDRDLSEVMTKSATKDVEDSIDITEAEMVDVS